MGIQNWSEDILLVDLPQEPEMGDELKTVTEMVRDRGNCDVVVDFSSVDIITSSSISKLLKLRKLLADCGHRLIFCSVAAATREPFGRLVAVGVATLLAVQVLINTAMNVGLLPITGLSLPMVSYGGSGLLAHAIALGLLLNIGLRPGYEVTNEPFRYVVE